MDNLQDLHYLVSKLESEYDKKEQIQILQQIGESLLTQYEIHIYDDVIQPLRIEAYYYPFLTPDKFCDPCAHPSSRKIGTFGKLYFIENQYGYPGIDLCLSQGNYYLSFLIKNSQIGKKCFKQMELFDRFSDNWREIESLPNVLKERQEPLVNAPVFRTSRVGLNLKRTEFAHELLSFVIDINKKENGKSVFNWAKGYGKERAVIDYMLRHPEEDRELQCKELLGYCSTAVLNAIKEK